MADQSKHDAKDLIQAWQGEQIEANMVVLAKAVARYYNELAKAGIPPVLAEPLVLAMQAHFLTTAQAIAVQGQGGTHG